MELPPERATISNQSATLARHAVVLTGEPSTENVNCSVGSSVQKMAGVIRGSANVGACSVTIPNPFAFGPALGKKPAGRNVMDVPPFRNLRPMGGKHLTAVFVDLDLADAIHPGPFEGKVEASDAGEE